MKASFFHAFLDLIYPPFHPCPHCRQKGTPIEGEKTALCPRCFADFPFLRPEEKPHNLEVLARYGQSAQSLIHHLKYKEGHYLAKPMARLMVKELVLGSQDLVLPVPMHPKRQKQRGYNQADLLARQIAAMVELEYESAVLVRIRETAPMVKLNRLQRIQNMWGSIKIPSRHIDRVKNQKVLLVDDVYTTGATTQACVQTLMEAGAREVTVTTFAVADI